LKRRKEHLLRGAKRKEPQEEEVLVANPLNVGGRSSFPFRSEREREREERREQKRLQSEDVFWPYIV